MPGQLFQGWVCSAPDVQRDMSCLRNTGDNEFGNKCEDVSYGFAIISSIMFSANLPGNVGKL